MCEAPVSEVLLRNIQEILILHYLAGDKDAKSFNIYAETVSERIGGKAIGTAVSCGVDSSFTIMKYSGEQYRNLKLSHLFIGSINAELWDFDENNDNLVTWENKHEEAFIRYYTVSKMTGLPLIKSKR